MAMRAPAVQPGQTLYPARYFMKDFPSPLTPLSAFAFSGGQITVPLRKQGYLGKLLVSLTGTYTVATAALIFIGLGAYNVVQNFNLQIPDAPLAPFNNGGAWAHIWELRTRAWSALRATWRFPAQGTLDAAATWATLVDQYPTATGAKTFSLWWTLQNTISGDDIRGIIPLGNATQANLLIQPAALANFVDATANYTVPVFTLNVVQYLTTPPPPGAPIIPTSSMPNADGVDVDWIVAVDENPQTILASGLNAVNVVPDWTILGIGHATILGKPTGNGAQLDSTCLDTINLRINSQFYAPNGPYPYNYFLAEQFYRNDIPTPEGFWLWDFDANGRSGWLYTDQTTEIQSQLYVNATKFASAGTNATISTSTRRLIDKNPAAHLFAAG